MTLPHESPLHEDLGSPNHSQHEFKGYSQPEICAWLSATAAMPHCGCDLFPHGDWGNPLKKQKGLC